LLENLLKDGSPPDGPFDSLYRVLTLTTKACTETLLKDESHPDDSLYQVFTLMAKDHTETD